MMTLMHEMMDEMHTMKVTQDPDIDYKVKQLAELGCEIVKGDLSDIASVRHALESMDAVYISIHTLAPQHKDTAELGFMDIEMNGLKNVVESCKMYQVQRLIYVTSIGISVDNKDAWTSGRWKTQQYLLNSGLNVTMIQPGMIVGIGGQGSVTYLAEQLHVSPDYLSGLLKTLTGMTAQQHIHEKLI